MQAAPPLRVVRFSGRALEEGVETHRIEGADVHFTSKAKTVADCFKYRNKIGLDVASARDSVKAEEIRGGHEYDGVRLRLGARLGQARIRLQVDIGFGDAVVPAPELIAVPSLDGLPPAQLRA
jgi:hypothetical protein